MISVGRKLVPAERPLRGQELLSMGKAEREREEGGRRRRRRGERSLWWAGEARGWRHRVCLLGAVICLSPLNFPNLLS